MVKKKAKKMLSFSPPEVKEKGLYIVTKQIEKS